MKENSATEKKQSPQEGPKAENIQNLCVWVCVCACVYCGGGAHISIAAASRKCCLIEGEQGGGHARYLHTRTHAHTQVQAHM